jgi:hypothetical protein
MFEADGKTVDLRNHRIAIGDGKPAAGAEVSLDIDDQQQFIISYLQRFRHRHSWKIPLLQSNLRGIFYPRSSIAG